MSGERLAKKPRLMEEMKRNSEMNLQLKDPFRNFERMAKVMDNRHDFKPDGRNKSIGLNTVMNILNPYFKTIIQSEMKPSQQRFRDIYEELIKIHCADYGDQCNKTPGNIDELAKEQFEHFFNTYYDLPYEEPKIKWNDFIKENNDLLNNVQVTIGSHADMDKLLPLHKSQEHLFLKGLMPKLEILLGTDRHRINFVIDTCALSELAFTSPLDKDTEKKAQTNPTLPHSRIYIGPGTDLDIFNAAIPTIGTTRYDFSFNTNTESHHSSTNHLILTEFKSSSEGIWNWKTKMSNGQIKFDRSAGTTRFGVLKFAELIQNTMAKSTHNKTLLDEFKKITGLNYDPKTISKVDFGRHIFDFKRLMDSSQIIYTYYLNRFGTDPNHELYGKKFIFITIDYMASCIARLLGVPTIFTRSKPQRAFTLYIPTQMTPEQKEIYKQKINQQNEDKRQEFLKEAGLLPTLPPLLEPKEPSIDLQVTQQTEGMVYINTPVPELLSDLFIYLHLYVVRAIQRLLSYKLLRPNLNEYTEEYRTKHRIYLSSGIHDEYKHLISIHEKIKPLISKPYQNKNLEHLLLEIQPIASKLIYFKLDVFMELIGSILSYLNPRYKLKHPNVYTLFIRKGPRSLNGQFLMYQTHPNMTNIDINRYHRWIDAISRMKEMLHSWKEVVSHPIDVSSQELPVLNEDEFQQLKKYAEASFEHEDQRSGGGPISPSSSQTPFDLPNTPEQPMMNYRIGSPEETEDLRKRSSETSVDQPSCKYFTTHSVNCFIQRYGDIPWNQLQNVKEFNHFMEISDKANLVRFLMMEILRKQEKRRAYEIHTRRSRKSQPNHPTHSHKETPFLKRFVKTLSSLKG